MKEILHFSAVLFLAGTIGEILQTTLHSSLKIVHRKNVNWFLYSTTLSAQKCYIAGLSLSNLNLND